MADTLRPHQHSSLAQLGATIQISGASEDQRASDEFDDAINELVARLDGEIKKASVLLDYHMNTFKANPSAQSWNELIAMMSVYQHLNRS